MVSPSAGIADSPSKISLKSIPSAPASLDSAAVSYFPLASPHRVTLKNVN